MKLIIGLGNPGKEYEHTRHNIGFRILDAFREKIEHSSWQESSKFNAMISRKEYWGEDVMLVKPMTYMNLSGGSVSKIVNFYKLSGSRDILVCYDDKDLIFGKSKSKNDSGSGGHNGIKSIIAALGTQVFSRLKFGVGHEYQKLATHDFVLQRFSDEEEEQLPELIEDAIREIQVWLSQD